MSGIVTTTDEKNLRQSSTVAHPHQPRPFFMSTDIHVTPIDVNLLYSTSRVKITMKITGVFLWLSVALTTSSAFAFVERDCSSPRRLEQESLLPHHAVRHVKQSDEQSFCGKHSITKFANLALTTAVSLSVLSAPFPSYADGQTEKFKLPPIDFSDKSRCTLSSSSIGQANAARDKLYDLRQCQLSGASAPGFDLSGVIMSKTDLSKANFQEAYFSKGYLQGMAMLVPIPCLTRVEVEQVPTVWNV
jgi:hypothetical protein